MNSQLKTEPSGSPPVLASRSLRNLKEMSISELVSVLHADFDIVKEVLVAREGKLNAEIGPLREKVEIERLMRVQAEEDLKKREEQLKKAQESYGTLLKQVQKNGLRDMSTIEELRNKIRELLHENRKLTELKKKWVAESNAVAELKTRVAKLENEKKSWTDDKNALAAIRIRCSELEDARKKDLATIEKLRVEICKLADEKKLKADAKLLRNVYASVGASDHVKGEALDRGPVEEGRRPWQVYTRRKRGRVALGIEMGTRRSCLVNRLNLGILLE